MDENRLSLLATFIGPCPECHNGKLQAVFAGGRANFLCRDCGCCWHVELGWVERVDPSVCPGCPSDAVCSAAKRPYGTRPVPVGAPSGLSADGR